MCVIYATIVEMYSHTSFLSVYTNRGVYGDCCKYVYFSNLLGFNVGRFYYVGNNNPFTLYYDYSTYGILR